MQSLVIAALYQPPTVLVYFLYDRAGGGVGVSASAKRETRLRFRRRLFIRPSYRSGAMREPGNPLVTMAYPLHRLTMMSYLYLKTTRRRE